MEKIRNVLRGKGTDIWSVGPRATVYEALEMMADKNVGALLVVNEGVLVGIFSERDYARKVILRGKTSRETFVEELMTRDVYTITPDASIEECMALMAQTHCRHMPVLEDGQLVGHILFSELAIQTNEGVLRAVALAPMAVRPEAQRRGIGSALV